MEFKYKIGQLIDSGGAYEKIVDQLYSTTKGYIYELVYMDTGYKDSYRDSHYYDESEICYYVSIGDLKLIDSIPDQEEEEYNGPVEPYPSSEFNRIMETLVYKENPFMALVSENESEEKERLTEEEKILEPINLPTKVYKDTSYIIGSGYLSLGPAILSTCECGKEKHGFASHSTWCPIKEE